MNVMLSYRRSDQDIKELEKIAAHLRRNGIEPWIDRQSIVPGRKWRDQLLEELRDCDVCIPILSSEYLRSEHCRMEVFIARSFGRKIVPIMLNDCFAELGDYEETRGLDELRIARFFELTVMGLPTSEQGLLDRVVAATVEKPLGGKWPPHAYISHRPIDAAFATSLAARLTAKGLNSWVATRDIQIGENWRAAQAKAMMRAHSHVIILAEDIATRPVFRSEVLFAEARGLKIITVLPSRLSHEPAAVAQLMDTLGRADQTYRRLADMQAVPGDLGIEETYEKVTALVRANLPDLSKAAPPAMLGLLRRFWR